MAPNGRNVYDELERMWKVAVVDCFKVCVYLLIHICCVICVLMYSIYRSYNITVPASHIGLKLLCPELISFMCDVSNVIFTFRQFNLIVIVNMLENDFNVYSYAWNGLRKGKMYRRVGVI